MYDTKQFKKGLKIEVEGIPYAIVDFQHVSPGKGGSFTRCKMKNMLSGAVTEKTFKSGDKVDVPDLENHEFTFLYKEGEHFVFMNSANYEQLPIDASVVGDQYLFLMENLPVEINFYNGKAIGIDLPNFIEAAIVETDPGFKGDTVSGAQKPAKIASGAKISVPLFIKEGDLVKVDTRDSSYVEKLSK